MTDFGENFVHVCWQEISVRTVSTGDRRLYTPHDNYFGQRKRIDENIEIYIYTSVYLL